MKLKIFYMTRQQLVKINNLELHKLKFKIKMNKCLSDVILANEDKSIEANKLSLRLKQIFDATLACEDKKFENDKLKFTYVI